MEQSDLLRLAVETLERLQIPYLVCGSVASGAFGEPRMTRDIDIVVDLRFGDVTALCDAFPAPEILRQQRVCHRSDPLGKAIQRRPSGVWQLDRLS